MKKTQKISHMSRLRDQRFDLHKYKTSISAIISQILISFQLASSRFNDVTKTMMMNYLQMITKFCGKNCLLKLFIISMHIFELLKTMSLSKLKTKFTNINEFTSNK